MIVQIEEVAKALEVIRASELARAQKLIADVEKAPLRDMGIREGESAVSLDDVGRVLGLSLLELEEERQEYGNSHILERYWKRRLADMHYIQYLHNQLEKGASDGAKVHRH